jgi:hypothetical protein
MAAQGVSKIPGWRIFCQRGNPILSLPRQCFSPAFGTNLVLTPEINGLRSIPHFILFLICFYFGFIKKPKASSKE